ncbi:MAG: winged helix-turn-helix transcriptional regulator [Gammaproteobacteria bacterium]|nr:winged helix-turn-helix transcriptional regulator [Gammaproteobacteria bacterium]
MVELSPHNLDFVFQALADPTRRAILREISQQKRSISEVARPFKMSLAAISKHLKVLERAGLLHREKQGCTYYISLNPDALQSAEEWMAYYQQFWTHNLRSLKNYLEQDNP